MVKWLAGNVRFMTKLKVIIPDRATRDEKEYDKKKSKISVMHTKNGMHVAGPVAVFAVVINVKLVARVILTCI